MNVNLYVIEDYKNETALMPKKTNPIQTQFQTSDICLLFSVFCFLSSVLRPQSSVLRLLFQYEAQIRPEKIGTAKDKNPTLPAVTAGVLFWRITYIFYELY